VAFITPHSFTFQDPKKKEVPISLHFWLDEGSEISSTHYSVLASDSSCSPEG